MRVLCCVCKTQEKISGEWKDISSQDYESAMNDSQLLISHGYCPDCLDKSRRELY
ncbi:MAG: hypothetical protein U9Q06_00650 [Nanoarchaeota archaeon]|nr:hypothetical protein [Nanoarchaeota archaeon]